MIERDEENYDERCWWQAQDEEHEMWVSDCAERAQDMNEEVRTPW